MFSISPCKLGVEPGYPHFIALNWFLGGFSLYKVQVPGFHLQTTLLSKAAKITSIKWYLPKQPSKSTFWFDGRYALLSLVGFYFIEVKVANHMFAARSSQFFLHVFSGSR